ncbi:hypothetical protein CKAN_02197700 [Cinnamomum micranthum f. kanehirae]|uniref:DUF632 domain-containing protein/DUF630 domain-containing protein n=1 Tax=Cinnamomum micranthum f. kanehirae TaxID=337451 RepID=A0A443PPU7_9MAGN|nr:hypothetical protein CKAN_02197700 [Cinnamomum micranthum f. kanehirae]
MGCGSSKVDDLPLVALCRERKELIRAAADHRYALAAAHVAYFDSLRGIGDALHRFVNEELYVVPSSPSSPVLTLPPSSRSKNKSSSSSVSLSHSLSHDSPADDDSHLHLHSDSASGDGDGDPSRGPSPRASSAASPPPPASSYYQSYMRSSTAIPTMIYQQPDDPYPYPNPNAYPTYGMGGFFGGDPIGDPYYGAPRQQSPPAPPPPPPPPPEVSSWDFLNPFDSYENFYPGRYGVRSSTSSPDSAQVREREGIPDLEDETAADHEPLKEVKKEKMNKASEGKFGEGTSKAIPEENDKFDLKKGSESKPGGSAPQSNAEEENVRKKGVSFGGETSLPDSVESARPSNLTAMSSHTTVDDSIESARPSNMTNISTNRSRDIREAVKEIKEQFETASGHGKEVAGLLEAGKLRYRPRNPVFEVFCCGVLDVIDPPKLTSSRPSSKHLQHTAPYAFAKSRDWVPGTKSGGLSSTLETLYAWEKKLYKEVKDEEKLRVIYEKKCKRLKYLDDRGAEINKIDATRASIRKLLIKISIAIKAIDTISSRIHKLRDEELKPQLTELVQGMIKMWKNMVKCHQKQFQVMLETKIHNLLGKTGIQRDSSIQAAKELEQELLKWYSCFNNWISSQKAYVDTLNGWLLKCLHQEPEVTEDGIVPFSPTRAGAPPVFIICNDWYHAMERISEIAVLQAMHTFATRVHMLWELQDEEQRQKLKAEFLSRDLDRRLKSLHQDTGLHGNDNALDKKAVLVSSKESIVLPDDDYGAALDTMKKRLEEERLKHEETLKQVHEAASSSLEIGLIPIFEAMDNFTIEILKAHEEVRTQNPAPS